MHNSTSNLINLSVTELDKDDANSKLRFAIKLLKGQTCIQTFERAISDAITIREGLSNAGFWWQAERLDNWIHRAQKKGDYLMGKDNAAVLRAEGSTLRSIGEVSFKKESVSFDLKAVWGI